MMYVPCTGSAKKRVLGCVNSPPQPEEARRQDSRNLGPTLSPSPIDFKIMLISLVNFVIYAHIGDHQTCHHLPQT